MLRGKKKKSGLGKLGFSFYQLQAPHPPPPKKKQKKNKKNKETKATLIQSNTQMILLTRQSEALGGTKRKSGLC